MYLLFQVVSCEVESTDFFSSPDIFCVVTFQGVKKQTEVVDETYNVIWAEKGTFLFPFDEEKEHFVFVDVYDKDLWSSTLLKSVSFNVLVVYAILIS